MLGHSGDEHATERSRHREKHTIVFQGKVSFCIRAKFTEAVESLVSRVRNTFSFGGRSI